METKAPLSNKLVCHICLSIDKNLTKLENENDLKFYINTLNEIPRSFKVYLSTIHKIRRRICIRWCQLAQYLYRPYPGSSQHSRPYPGIFCFQITKAPDGSPQICPNCSITLQKARVFKEQIKSSYKILQSYNDEAFRNRVSLVVSLLREDGVDYVQHLLPSQLSADRVQRRELVNILNYKTDLNSYTSETKAPIEEIDVNDESTEVKQEVAIEWTDNEVMIKQLKEEDSNDGFFFDDLPLSYAKDIAKKKKKKRKKKDLLQLDYKINSKSRSLEHNSEQKIKLIHLTYEEMMEERESDMRCETYLLAKFKCDGCVIGFSGKKAYDNHIENKHSQNRGSYKCPICKTTHSDVEAFTLHYRRHTRRYVCGICGKRTVDMKAMHNHATVYHEVTLKEYKCKYCEKIFNSPNSHRYHLDTHKGRLKCKLCDKTFIHRSALKNHKISVHELNNKFPCDVCSKVFRWKTSLSRHIVSHHSENKNTSVAYCELCNVSFTMISNYQRHLNTSLKHVSKDQLRFICDHCNRRFSNKTKLRDHIEDKHLHRTFVCEVCKKVSKNRVALDQHIRNVHNRRPKNKICHHCGKGFPTKSQLESHIRMHTGERPFFCQYCNSSFSQQSNLYKHNRQVHLNVKAKKYTSLTKKAPEEKPQEMSIEPATYPVTLAFQYTTELNDNIIL